GETGNRNRVAEIERAELRPHPQPDSVAGRQAGQEVDAHAELTELDGDGPGRGPALHHWERELAASQKISLAVVQRDQVGLRQQLQQPFLLQRADGSTEVEVGAESKNV